MELSEEKCQPLDPPEQKVRGVTALQVLHTITTHLPVDIIRAGLQNWFCVCLSSKAKKHISHKPVHNYPLIFLQMECLEDARRWPLQTCTHTIFLPLRCNASGSSYRNWLTEVHAASLPVHLCCVFCFFLSVQASLSVVYRARNKCLSTAIVWGKPTKPSCLVGYRSTTIELEQVTRLILGNCFAIIT